MKFLDPYWETRDIIPINVTYNGDEWDKDDVLCITFKDLGDGTLHSHTITNPKVDVWIVKPEFRNFSHHRDYIKKDQLFMETVPYRSRMKHLANKYHMSPDEVKFSPYILGTDVDVKTAYLFYFLIEYPTKEMVNVNMGFLDIENDTIDFTGFPPPGQAPINMITYISKKNKVSHTVILRNPKNPLIDQLENDIDGFIRELHSEFDADFGSFDYDISFYDDEISMIAVIFQLINLYEDDYLGGWNMPYDAGELIERCRYLGYDPVQIMQHPEIKINKIDYRKDDNPAPQKRKHILQLGTKSTWTDMLVNYAGVRRGGGKLPSMRLNNIAEIELGQGKYDYSEAGNIKTAPWTDFRTFTKYNIKDVLLLDAIDTKTGDIQDLALTCTLDGMLISDAFVTTTQLTNSLRLYLYKKGYIMGNNRNKLFDAKEKNKKYLKLTMSEEEAEEELSIYEILEEEMDTEEEDDDSPASKKKKKFSGALVSNPNRMQPSGHVVDGIESKFIHDHTIDFDATSEYPSAMRAMNASNETFVGKVILKGEKNIPVPMHYYEFIDDEAEGYKMKASEILMEHYCEGDMISLGETFLNLPSIGDVLAKIAENPAKYMKN